MRKSFALGLVLSLISLMCAVDLLSSYFTDRQQQEITLQKEIPVLPSVEVFFDRPETPSVEIMDADPTNRGVSPVVDPRCNSPGSADACIQRDI